MNPSIPNYLRTSSSDPANSGPARLETSPLPSSCGAAASNEFPADVSAQRQSRLTGRIGLNQVTTLPWCLSEDLEEYQAAGIAAIGLNWRKLNEFGLRRAMRCVAQSGMQVSSLGCLGGFTGEHGYTRDDVLTDGRRMIRVAGQLRAGTLTVVTGPLGGHIRSNANRLVVDALKELVPLAALYGVQLALQPMHQMFARNWSFLHSLDETLTILDRVQDSRLKVAFGTYHLWQEPQLLERLPELTSRIGLVRLADWGDAPRDDHDRLLPGTGRLPIAEVIHTLETNRYSGWYELEVWSRDLWKRDRRDLMQACLMARDALSLPFTA